MNCKDCKENMVEYIEGLLDESQKQAVSEHLKGCPNCRAEVQQLTNLHERLVKNGKALARDDFENDVMNKILREQNVKLKKAARASKALDIRSIIMKSPFVKIAAAAVIIIAVLIGLNPFGGTITFAEVVEPILNAKAMIYDFFIGDEATGTVMHDIIMGQRIRRTISSLPGMTHIIDLENSQILVLTEEGKTASYIDIQGELGNRNQSYVKFLRQTITNLKDNYRELGKQEIDGQTTIAFEASGPNESVKIWADPETALPVRIELSLGQMFVILKNFEFDPAIDELLVSMKVPAGYTLKEAPFNLGNATEEDFVESLRVWAKVLGDGVFPEEIGTEAIMKQMPALIEKLKEMNVSEEEGTKIGMAFGKGMLFHQTLELQGKYQYTGAGVKFGDASKVVFWYQPKGSSTYRVIYGDLSVKDVVPEDLPQ